MQLPAKGVASARFQKKYKTNDPAPWSLHTLALWSMREDEIKFQKSKTFLTHEPQWHLQADRSAPIYVAQSAVFQLKKAWDTFWRHFRFVISRHQREVILVSAPSVWSNSLLYFSRLARVEKLEFEFIFQPAAWRAGHKLAKNHRSPMLRDTDGAARIGFQTLTVCVLAH